MKILVILVSFLVAENVRTEMWLNQHRVQWEIQTDDVLEVAVKTMRSFDDFQRLLNENNYNNTSDNFTIRPGKFVDSSGAVHDALRAMSSRFMSVSFAHFARTMIEYYALAVRFLDESVDYNEDEDKRRATRDLIGMSDDRGLCMLTAFYDSGVAVDEALETVFFSMSVAPDKINFFPRGGLINELGANKKKYENYFNLPEYAQMCPSPDAVYVQSSERMRRVKKAIAHFSDVFCSQRWRPLVGNFLLAKAPQVDYRRHRSAVFVRHVFENEVCAVHNSGEYGFEKYEVDVKRTRRWSRSLMCRFGGYDMTFYLWATRQVPQSESLQSPTTTENTRVNLENSFSLAGLRNKFHGDCENYKNSVIFYNIASDVMLLVSIREGSKIFKAIKHVVKRDCAVNISVVEILGLRSTLFAFKTVFDRLVTVMQDRKRIDVTDNRDKKTFEGQMDSLLKFLDVQDEGTDDGMSILEMCSQVPDLLSDEKYNAHLGDNEYATVKFREFYLTLPVLHVHQLYQFYAHDFL